MANKITASKFSNIFWIESIKRPSSEAIRYHIYGSFNYKIPPDLHKLQDALQAVVNNNYNLRSNFKEENGELKQIIHDKVDVNLDVHYVNSQADYYRIKDSLYKKPFDLSNDPLFRFSCIFIKDLSKTVLLPIFHHIIIDGTQFDSTMHEIEKFYHTEPNLNKNDSKEIYNLQEYINWEADRIMEADISYWDKKLSGCNLQIDLPYNSLSIDNTKPRTNTQLFELDEDLYSRISLFATKMGCSIFDILKVAWAFVISVYSNQNEIALTFPFNTRRRKYRDVKGAFLNSCIFLFNKELSFIECIKNENAIKRHIQNNYISIIDVKTRHKELSITCSISQTDLAINGPKLEEKANYTFNIELGASDLCLFINPQRERLDYGIVAVQNLFDMPMLGQLSNNLATILEKLINNPNQKMTRISSLTKSNKRVLLSEFSRDNYPKNNQSCISNIVELFEMQERHNPQNTALIYDKECISYNQVNQKANQIAHHLISMGIGNGSLVGICLDRTPELVIGILSILKAGAAYVPLDANYPDHRTKFILKDTKIKVLITVEHMYSKFEKYNINCLLINKIECFAKIKNESNLNPIFTRNKNDAAYVTYTSGSTGKPKGVIVEHASVVTLISKTNYVTLSNSNIIVSASSISFDGSTFDIWGALLNGAALVISKERDILEFEFWENIISEYPSCSIFMTVRLFDKLVEQQPNIFGKINDLFIGGEKLNTHKISSVLAQTERPINFLQVYGVTESTTFSTSFKIENDQTDRIIPIGKPIKDTQIYILDQMLEPVPIGAIGEIYIAGAGLARGYMNSPGLTSEKFIANLFATESDLQKGYTRLYKTGDLGRFLPDGNIEYKGRKDDQIKLRGFRIELGEIEHSLNSYSEVSQSAVIVKEDISSSEESNKQILAYVVPSAELRDNLIDIDCFISSTNEEINVLGGDAYTEYTDKLKCKLTKELPEYMIPASIVFIEKIPLTHNGKLDKKCLPKAEMDKALANTYVAPRDRVEQCLCDIWEEVLGLARVGINDNFFQIGGDSIQCIRVISKANNLGIKISVKDIFDQLNIANLRQVATILKQSSSKINQCVIKGDLPLTPIVHWFFEQNYSNKNYYNQEILLSPSNRFDIKVLVDSFKVLLSHHDGLRLRFKKKGVEWLSEIITPEECIKHQGSICRYVDVSHLSDTEQDNEIAQISQETREILNIETGPMLQSVLFNCGDNYQKLLVVIHHLSVDGVSWQILLEDLENIYAQIENNNDIDIPSKTNSYQDWAYGLSEYAKNINLQNEIVYWEGMYPQYCLPLDKDSDVRKQPHHTLRSIKIILSQDDTQLLLHKIHHAYNTQINDILLTALAITVSEWLNHNEICISLEGHGREEVIGLDVSRTIGWFTSIFPVKLNLEGYDTESYIKSIKEQLRSIPNKGIGYGVLRYLSSPEIQSRLTKDTPEISFNYLGQWDNLSQDNNLSIFGGESLASSISGDNTRFNLLDINSLVINGQFEVIFSYSYNHYDDSTIEKIANRYQHHLKTLITHCFKVREVQYTPSDFPLSNLTQTELDRCVEISPVGLESIYILSPMQEGLLFNELYKDSDEYLVQGVYEIKGHVDDSALRASWNAVVQHHPILRTGFIYEGINNPVQYVLNSVEIPWIEESYPELPHAEILSKLDKILIEDRKKRFDLNSPPLMRFRLLKCSQNKAYLIWTSHHLLSDGWCLPIFIDQVLQAYIQLSEGRPVQLPYSPPYERYISWLHSQDKNKAKEFWRDYLFGIETGTELNLKGGSGIEKNDNGYDYYDITFDEQLSQQIANFSHETGITVNTIFQGAWAFVLSRYLQQKDVVFGVTVSGRSIDLPNIEKMVGLFINTLPLRVRVDDTMNIEKYLKTIQNNMASMINFGYLSLAEIQKQSNLNYSGKLFNTTLSYQNYPLNSANKESNLNISNFRYVEKSEYSLNISVFTQNQLNIRCSYQTSLFGKKQIMILTANMQEVLKNIVSVQSPDLKEKNSDK